MYIFFIAMQVILRIIFLVAIPSLCALGQNKIAFVSDTQAPMWIEDVFLKSNNNEKATALLFSEIVNQKPTDLFILGDVVSLGHKEKKWKAMDDYLQRCRQEGIKVSALLGNHDVMSKPKKGEQKFQQRFPDQVRTGFTKVTDSIAVVMLNSNFKKLSQKDMETQQAWLKTELLELDMNTSIKTIVVSCHHAPYSNSKIVGSSELVQKYFVPLFLKSAKSKLFITGHSHAFEHFKKEGKDFLVIGGGGGIHQPLKSENFTWQDLASDYKPMFHYLDMTRQGNSLSLISHSLKKDFSGFETGYSFIIP
jgi:UDP-2,3-diacylglucosamine pyrophosphatase LpxH